jgi:hypothetical protein
MVVGLQDRIFCTTYKTAWVSMGFLLCVLILMYAKAIKVISRGGVLQICFALW